MFPGILTPIRPLFFCNPRTLPSPRPETLLAQILAQLRCRSHPDRPFPQRRRSWETFVRCEFAGKRSQGVIRSILGWKTRVYPAPTQTRLKSDFAPSRYHLSPASPVRTAHYSPSPLLLTAWSVLSKASTVDSACIGAEKFRPFAASLPLFGLG
jgi:hypothetical protein